MRKRSIFLSPAERAAHRLKGSFGMKEWKVASEPVRRRDDIILRSCARDPTLQGNEVAVRRRSKVVPRFIRPLLFLMKLAGAFFISQVIYALEVNSEKGE